TVRDRTRPRFGARATAIVRPRGASFTPDVPGGPPGPATANVATARSSSAPPLPGVDVGSKTPEDETSAARVREPAAVPATVSDSVAAAPGPRVPICHAPETPLKPPWLEVAVRYA